MQTGQYLFRIGAASGNEYFRAGADSIARNSCSHLQGDKWHTGRAKSYRSYTNMLGSLVFCAIGLVILTYAADKLVEGASNLAINIGVSKMVIGLTIVAAGPPMTELVVRVNASLKGNPALSLGNVVGSNIFNLLGIVGCAAALPLVIPGSTPANYLIVSPNMLGIHIPLMFVVGLGVLPIMRTGMKIVRLEGALLLACYIAYTVMLYQTAGSESPKPSPVPAISIEAPAPGNGQTATATAETAQPASATAVFESAPALPTAASATVTTP